MKTKIFSIIAVSILVFSALFTFKCEALDSSEVYLGGRKIGVEKIQIAVADIKPKIESHEIAYISKEAVNILVKDLTLTGIFSAISNRSFINEVNNIDRTEGKIVYKEWWQIGAQALVKGSYLFKKGKLVVDLRLYDVLEGKLILNKRYSAKTKGLRMIMHKFCDDIVFLLTGVPGVARTKITFVSHYSGNKEIYVMDYDGYNLRRLTSEKSIALSPAWSADGKEIAFTTYRYNNPDIYSVNVRRRRRKVISKYRGLNTTPAFSPDGKYIAMTLSKDKNSEIYVMNVNGSGLRRLTNNRGIDTSPSWSPDSNKLVFISDRSGRPHLYTINLDGSGLKRITFSKGENQSPAWSTKGDKIAYSARQKNRFNIYMIDVDGKNIVQLTQNSGNNENPSWSPDGRHIIFESTRNGTRQLYMLHVEGSGQHKISNLKGGGYNPDWSPRFQ